ncbi:MAG: THUMP domain-containing protein [Candidatus Methanomethylophilaceae archaeon]
MIGRPVATILVRYCEIGLKSTPVRKRFENQLRDNMLTMLAYDKVEAFVTYADARFYIETENTDGCVRSLKKVFGIVSLSVAEVCSSEMEDICATAAKYSLGKLSRGDSFAVRARREGDHIYTSMDVGREAGSAIFIANERLGITVDLRSPDRIFYIEVRNNKAFVFDEYVQCPGGLPLGSQGRVIAEVNDDRGTVSAWMMMKRGCRTLVTGVDDISILKEYDPMLKVLESTENVGKIRGILGKVSGTTLEGLKSMDVSKYDVPVYFPTIGMDDRQVHDMLCKIRTHSF